MTSCALICTTRAGIGNRTGRSGWTAIELAKVSTYYIMDRDESIAETVAKEMPSAAEIATQGNRISKCGQQLPEKAIVPPGPFELAAQGSLRSLLLNDVQGHMTQDRVIIRTEVVPENWTGR